jgi:hypothetical protein
VRARNLALLSLAPLVAACGRLGYDALESTTSPDASPSDAAPAADAPPDAPPAPDAAPALDFCTVLPALASPPTIDGVLEPGLTLRAIDPAEWFGAGTGIPAGQSARWAAAWRPDGVYVYVEVVDPTRLPAPAGEFRWCGDGAEVYVDDNGLWLNPHVYDDPGTRQLVVAAPADGTTVVHGGEAWCSTCGDTVPRQLPGAPFVAVPRQGGYAVVTFVGAYEIARSTWSLAAGDHVGLDVAVNVSESAPTGAACVFDGSSSGNQRGQYFVRADVASAVYPFDDTDAFCTPALLAP